MSGRNNNGNSSQANALDSYNSERTKQIIGKMLSEYADDENKNYFDSPRRDDTLFDAEEYMQEVREKADEFERLKRGTKKDEPDFENEEDETEDDINLMHTSIFKEKITIPEKPAVSSRDKYREAFGHDEDENDEEEAENKGFSIAGFMSAVKKFVAVPEDDYEEYDNEDKELDGILNDDYPVSKARKKEKGTAKRTEKNGTTAAERMFRSNTQKERYRSVDTEKNAGKYSRATSESAKKAAEELIERIVGMTDDDELDITEPDYIENQPQTFEEDENHLRATVSYKESIGKIREALENDKKRIAETKSVIEEERSQRAKAEEEERLRAEEERKRFEEEAAKEREVERAKMLEAEKAKEEADRIAREEATERKKRIAEAKRAEDEAKRAEEEAARAEAEAKAAEETARAEAEARAAEASRAEAEAKAAEEAAKAEEEAKAAKEAEKAEIEAKAAEAVNEEIGKNRGDKNKRKSSKKHKKSTGEAHQESATAQAEPIVEISENTEIKTSEDDMRRDAKSITDDIIAAATMDTDDDMEEETVRRSRKRSSKSRKQAEQNEYDEDYFDDFDEDETILPEVVKTEEVKTETPKKKPRRVKADDEITSILDDDDDDVEEESVSVSNVKEVRIPLKGILLTLLILILVTAVTGMGFLCRKNQQRLDEAQDEIRELKSNDSSAQYEAKIKELENRVADLTAQNEFLSSGGLQTVETSTTDTNNGATDEKTDETADKASDENSDDKDENKEAGEKTYIVQNGDSFYSIAQKMYGDGSRYADILEANGMNEENAKLVVGDEIKIPQ